jgi:hypothetical protein
MRCSVALRAHSRPPGPAARSGWRPTAHYSALCRSYRFGCGAGELCSHTRRRLVPRVRSWRWAEPRAMRSAGVAGDWLPAALRVIGLFDDCPAQAPGGGKRRCRPQRRCLSLHAHERRMSNNHTRPSTVTINTTMMLHGVDEVGSSLGVADFGFAGVS